MGWVGLGWVGLGDGRSGSASEADWTRAMSRVDAKHTWSRQSPQPVAAVWQLVADGWVVGVGRGAERRVWRERESERERAQQQQQQQQQP